MGPEWCWDYYSSKQYEAGDIYNPYGPKTGESKEVYMSIIYEGRDKLNAACRVLRGGEYEHLADRDNETTAKYNSVYARSYSHPENYDRPGADSSLFMFRVVRNAPKPANRKVYRNVEVMISGVPYYYFMTDDLYALYDEYPDSNIKDLYDDDLIENPNLSPAVISKMQELGCTWSVTFSNGSSVLNYYDENFGPLIAYINKNANKVSTKSQKTQTIKKTETAKTEPAKTQAATPKIQIRQGWYNSQELKEWRSYLDKNIPKANHQAIFDALEEYMNNNIEKWGGPSMNKYSVRSVSYSLQAKQILPKNFKLPGKMSDAKFADLLNKICI